jgi:crossover junction endodeoxyribonuclease RuvC
MLILGIDPGRREVERMVEIATDLWVLLCRWRPRLSAVVQTRGVVLMTLAVALTGWFQR